ncbi:MAG: O-antigen ligase domain-containing protein [Pedosphaera sp.]|nr:O-antigen ligase domain-containing protein [Pedosphaera sp.]
MRATIPLPQTRPSTSQRANSATFGISSRAIVYFLFYSLLLTPLGWITVNGIYHRQTFLIVGVISMGFVAFMGLLPRMAQNFALFVFVALFGLFTRYFPQVETYDWKDILTGTFYAVTAGTVLGAARERRSALSLVTALVALAASTTFIAILMVRSAGGAGALRNEYEMEVETAGILFGGLMGDKNVVIGVIPMTTCSLSLLPFVILQPFRWLNLLLVPTIAAALYVNVAVASRTALTVALITTMGFLIYAIRQGSQRGRYAVAVILSAAVVIPVSGLIFPSIEQYLEPVIKRFAHVAEDGRLSLWGEGIDLLIRNPFGNGIQQFTQHQWAHNLFLDVGLNGGIVAIAMVAGYHLLALIISRRFHQMKLLDPATPEAVLFMFALSIFLCAQVLVPLTMFIVMIVLMCAYGQSLLLSPIVKRTFTRRNPVPIHRNLQQRRPLTAPRIPAA